MEKEIIYVEKRPTYAEKRPSHVETRSILVQHRNGARMGSGMSGESSGNMNCVLVANSQEGVPNMLADMHERRQRRLLHYDGKTNGGICTCIDV